MFGQWENVTVLLLPTVLPPLICYLLLLNRLCCSGVSSSGPGLPTGVTTGRDRTNVTQVFLVFVYFRTNASRQLAATDLFWLPHCVSGWVLGVLFLFI